MYEPSVVVHACNPITQEVEAVGEEHKFKVIFSYIY